MGVLVAEYHGQRTEVSSPAVDRVTSADTLCPFMKGTPCKKLLNDKKPPVCAVRKTSRGEKGKAWISCPKRLCASQSSLDLSDYQKEMLYAIAKVLYGDSISKTDLLVKSEVPIKLESKGSSSYRADYIFALKDKSKKTTNGPEKLIVEMQGGGETSNTGKITARVNAWVNDVSQANSDLAGIESSVGTLETNAWRRQQEQFLVKGSAAKATALTCGIALCIGESLYDYLVNKIGEKQIEGNKIKASDTWTFAIIPIVETDPSDPSAVKINSDCIPFKPDAEKTLYFDYNRFVNLLTNQGAKSEAAFSGEYKDLAGGKVKIQ